MWCEERDRSKEFRFTPHMLSAKLNGYRNVFSVRPFFRLMMCKENERRNKVETLIEIEIRSISDQHIWLFDFWSLGIWNWFTYSLKRRRKITNRVSMMVGIITFNKLVLFSNNNFFMQNDQGDCYSQLW